MNSPPCRARTPALPTCHDLPPAVPVRPASRRRRPGRPQRDARDREQRPGGQRSLPGAEGVGQWRAHARRHRAAQAAPGGVEAGDQPGAGREARLDHRGQQGLGDDDPRSHDRRAAQLEPGGRPSRRAAVPRDKHAGPQAVAAAHVRRQRDAHPITSVGTAKAPAAGIVHSTMGQSGGYLLTRPAGEISALEVVRAVDGDEPAYRCTEIRQRGPLGVPAERCARPCAIARAMAAAQDAWSRALAQVSIADLAADIDADSDGTAMTAVRRWLTATGN
ncbi:RrF2 family transcriptional regulator [Streptosporangium saharense]|uniref:RrF2 family transcriptional regulator n=1 Tax=Streptosporangium saharense TaxID=1706840 RepID=UPI0036AD7147